MKVIGWTSWNDFDNYPKDASSIDEDALQAVAGAVREHGYKFSGDDHQYHDNCTPVFDNGTVFRASQRGWGAVMAAAYPEECGTDKYAYCMWAFQNPAPPVYPCV